MKKLLCIFIILLIAIGLGFLIQKDPGYVLIAYNHWIIATSFWIGLVTFLMVFIIFYFVVRVIKNTLAIPDFFSRRNTLIRAQKYNQWMTRGITELAIGNFKKAEKYFIKTSTLSNHSYVNYLLAAQAAQAQNKKDQRDCFIQKAFDIAGNSSFVVSLTQAQLLLQSQAYEAALAILIKLLPEQPKNNLILNALKAIYLQQKNWKALSIIMPVLKTIISDNEFFNLELEIFQNKINTGLEKNEMADHIHLAEKWLKKYPDHYKVLLIMAQLYLKANIPGKARSFAEKCVQLNSNAEAYILLGKTHEALGQHDVAMTCYRKL